LLEILGNFRLGFPNWSSVSDGVNDNCTGVRENTAKMSHTYIVLYVHCHKRDTDVLLSQNKITAFIKKLEIWETRIMIIRFLVCVTALPANP